MKPKANFIRRQTRFFRNPHRACHPDRKTPVSIAITMEITVKITVFYIIFRRKTLNTGMDRGRRRKSLFCNCVPETLESI
jgi:hypothetical protein